MTDDSRIEGLDERAVVALYALEALASVQHDQQHVRLANPLSRAVALFKFHRNGGSTKSMACVACGAEGPTWCAKYPKTLRAERWEAEHRAGHELPWASRASSRLMATSWAQEMLAQGRSAARASMLWAAA